MYCFKSDKFQIINNEDSQTNPGIYGLEFAKWLKEELIKSGYKIQDVTPEDWGWCITIKTDSAFWLCVACRGEYYDTDLVWSCFIEAKKSIWRNPFKKIDTTQSLQNLDENLKEILSKNFSLIECF